MNRKKLGKRTLCAILSGVLCIAFAVLAITGFSAQRGMRLEEVRDGIVWVHVMLYDADGSALAGGSGTGWAIGKPGEPIEYIVTNGHVVQYAYEYPRAEPEKYMGSISVYFSAAENDAVTPQVVFYSPPEVNDIAILKLPTPTDKRVPLLLRASDTVEPGETAYALGYPGISSERQDYVKFDPSDITITKGIVSKRTTVTWSDYNVFQMDVAIAGGNSGGPLVDEHGYVLGINTSGAVQQLDEQTTVDLGMNYAIVSDDLIRILNDEGIPYAMRRVGVLPYIYAALALACLAAAAVLYFGKSREAPAAAGAPADMGKKPVLRGVTGKYAGQTFALSGAKVTLGRDSARCNVVFEPNAPGVSADHCSVYYDANADRFMLTDNGSSYGTFLGNGKKLTATVPEKLSAGDSFYLADSTNRFIVTKE